MSDCERLESTLEAYVAGELDDTRIGPLLAHCRGCSDCRGLLELHRDLLVLAAGTREPDDAAFEGMQTRVLREADRRDATRAPRRRVGRPAPWRLASPVVRAAAALAAGIALFVAGLAAGRAFPERAGTDGNGGLQHRLIRAISADAAGNRELDDVEDSRFTYSNVSFRRVDGNRVALDFDVATHVQLVEPADSELVREVLVHALLGPTSTGARLKALSYAGGATEPKVREALIFALRRDDSLAVRLKALSVLAERLDLPEVESAVLGTLRDDDSVQMRLLALEYLAGHRVDPERIREVIRANQQPGDEALMVRLAEFDDRS